MEHCEDILENKMRRGEINDANKEVYFKQILTGLKMIDEKGLVHRDLKPNNIFIDLNNYERGNRHFRPPEHMHSDEIRGGNITTIVDVYSFGLMYHFMCFKRELDSKKLVELTGHIRDYRLCYNVNDELCIKDRE
ncbi:PEK/GCN2 protein kinase-like protein [Leptotrombidium deliense]|uniref:PEK/GCN2 protein kinase-like protein n=1 Tax=Leptotrombidium deliense TaxID=299467 RepID=A0A443RYI9_9ACAR|nr:PEK/GCN2 protein kinase-like protein [Leptotrombidium deliense]